MVDRPAIQVGDHRVTYAELETELGSETSDKLYDSVLLVHKDET